METDSLAVPKRGGLATMVVVWTLEEAFQGGATTTLVLPAAVVAALHMRTAVRGGVGASPSLSTTLPTSRCMVSAIFVANSVAVARSLSLSLFLSLSLSLSRSHSLCLSLPRQLY